MIATALALMVLPRPTVHHPNIRIETPQGVKLELLLQGQQDAGKCERAAAAVSNAVKATCSNCVVQNLCLKELNPGHRRMISDGPLNVPSVRMPNGVVIFYADQPAEAMIACEETVKQNQKNPSAGTAVCHPPGTSRPVLAQSPEGAERTHTTYTMMLAILGVVLGGLAAAVIVTYLQKRSRQTHSVTNPWLQKSCLAGVDLVVLLTTFLALSWPGIDDVHGWGRLDRVAVFGHAAIIAITVGWFWSSLEHYARRRPFWDELREVFRVLTIMFMVSGAVAFVAGLDTAPTSHLVMWACNFLLLPLGRGGVRQLLADLDLWKVPAVIVGTGDNAREAALAIVGESSMGYRISGFINAGEHGSPSSSPPADGTDALHLLPESVLFAPGFDARIILALDSMTTPESQSLIRRILIAHRNIHVIPSIRGLPLFGTQLSHFFSHEVLFLTVRSNLSRRSLQFIKRTFDILGAVVLLIALCPLMAYVAWRIWREDGSPIIFHQPRLARGSGEFGFLKFRSMVRNADEVLARWRKSDSPEWREYYSCNFKLKNDPRLLGVGSWIRSMSIDELPQLVNVIKGEMSLVGPRPLLARELVEYGDSIHFYRQARPGITGLWQISGRSETKFEDRALLDEWYVQNWSLWYDIAILFKTIRVVFAREGAH
jgi:UDP-galactose-lipid carrier transferase